jgi:hypothetical protein
MFPNSAKAIADGIDEALDYTVRGSEADLMKAVKRTLHPSVITNAGYGPDYPFTRGHQIVVTLFERDVVISLLESALNGWEGNQARQNAATRVLKKLKGEL